MIATIQGNPEIVKRITEKGVNADKTIFYRSIIKGNLAIIQILVDNGYQLTKEDLMYASVYSQNQKIIKYLKEVWARQNP